MKSSENAMPTPTETPRDPRTYMAAERSFLAWIISGDSPQVLPPARRGNKAVAE